MNRFSCNTSRKRTHPINTQGIRKTNDENRAFRYLTISETIKSATMLMTLIIGLIAGPAVSL
jgi:hypothetical protein